MSQSLEILKDADICADNPAHFELLVRRHQGSVFAFLGRMGFDRAHAEDIAQDSFLKAWRALKSYSSDKAAFSTWLFTIVRNTALSDIAKTKRRPLLFDTDTVEREAHFTEATDHIEKQQLQDRLQNLMKKLSPEDRAVIALSYNEELNSNEAATVLGCAAGAYRTRLTRAKQRLKKQWEESDE